jgi:DNA (cytosine-5)-methyltransferase 1
MNTPMNYLSVCSGIEAASTAWHGLGWTPVAFSEIEPFPSAVLAHHWPDVPNLGDMTKHNEWPTLHPDLLVGGTPAKPSPSPDSAKVWRTLAETSHSSSLAFLSVLRPRWVVWENVPGVLSDKTGAFGAFLGGLGELGYGFAYRILDAQHFGVAQRRRRVFVVGYLGDWRRAAAVLFEPESLRGDPAPSREAGQDTTGSTGDGVARCITTGEAKRQDWETCNMIAATYANKGHFGSMSEVEVSDPLRSKGGDTGNGGESLVTHSLRGEGFDASEDGTGRGTPLVPVVAPTVTSNGDSHSGFRDERGLVPVCYGIDEDQNAREEQMGCLKARQEGGGFEGAVAFAEVAQPIRSNGYNNSDPSMEARMHVQQGMQVRRLTPTECERLQGFPDGHTLIPWRGKTADSCPDGPRYKALGNSMAVPVMRWIGERIQAADRLA